jgi:hypothetical protein
VQQQPKQWQQRYPNNRYQNYNTGFGNQQLPAALDLYTQLTNQLLQANNQLQQALTSRATGPQGGAMGWGPGPHMAWPGRFPILPPPQRYFPLPHEMGGLMQQQDDDSTPGWAPQYPQQQYQQQFPQQQQQQQLYQQQQQQQQQHPVDFRPLTAAPSQGAAQAPTRQ